MTGAIVLLVILITALGGIYMIVRFRRPGVTDFRAQATGDLIPLKMGTTHVTCHGPEDGPVLVCIHGLSTPSFVWEPLVPYLTGLGYRVITYDLYGRGHSDRVMGRQNATFFLRHLDQLLEAEGVTGRFALMGYSMGGAIAAAFVARSPDRVLALILLASAGLDYNATPTAAFVRKWPVIGDWLQEVFGARLFRRAFADMPYTDPTAQSIITRMCAEIDKSGTLAAMLSSARGILSDDQTEIHQTIAAAGLPVLAIWGSDDGTIPISSMGRLARANRKAMQFELEGADHGLAFTHPASVAEAIEENL
jgi:pimeloyl-ACP methyl ester carboxylesterase